jgi:hypothetical protein
MPYDTAVAEGAIALFGEKYEKDVRVLRFGEFSMELCGGTHVERVGDIGIFKILSESGVAAGVRRIEAITAEGALEYLDHTDQIVKEVAGLVRGSRDDVKAKVADALDRIRQLEKENRSLKDKLASGQGTDLSAGAGGADSPPAPEVPPEPVEWVPRAAVPSLRTEQAAAVVGDRIYGTRSRAEFVAHERFDALQRRRKCRRIVATRLREVRTTAALAADLAGHVPDQLTGFHFADLVGGDARDQRDLVSCVHRRQHDDGALELVLELIHRVAQCARVGAVHLRGQDFDTCNIGCPGRKIRALPARKLVLELAIFLFELADAF